MATRINARIDQELADKLEQIQRITGKSTSAILKAALDRYYERVQQDQVSPGEALRKLGFVASGKGTRELSSNYKKILTESLAKKT